MNAASPSLSTGRSSAITSGLFAALRHRRLAGLLWFSLFASAGLACLPLGRMTAAFDQSPFRETVLKGWDSWAVASWLVFRPQELAFLGPVFLTSILFGVVAHLLVTMGGLRVLVADIPRPVLRRTLADGAALFRPAVWAFLRYLFTLAFWGGLLAALPAWGLKKLAGEEAPPNSGLATAAGLWAIFVLAAVFVNVSLRHTLARIALAREDAPSARGAFRVAKQRLRGARLPAAGIFLVWLAAGGVVQLLFTRIGVAMNPSTGGGLLALFLVRQAGFFLLAMTRVGYWASLLAFEKAHRPPPWKPLAAFRMEEPPAALPLPGEPAST